MTVTEESIHTVADLVEYEARRAMVIHPPVKDRHEAYAKILEELDEFWDEVKLNPTKMTALEAEEWTRRMRKELIQVAAMSIKSIVGLGLPLSEVINVRRLEE